MFDLEWYELLNAILMFRAKMDNNTNIRTLCHNLRFSINSEDIHNVCVKYKINTTQLSILSMYVSLIKLYFNIHNKTDINIATSLGKYIVAKHNL